MKKLILPLLLIINILFIRGVSALTQTDEYIIEGESIPGIYFYKHRSDTDDIKYEYHNFHKQATVYRTSKYNQVVYCIESWAPLNGASANSYGISTDYKETNLSYEQNQKIKEYAYYGYGYKDNNVDHTDLKWYAITQYLIWKIQAPNIEHYFVSSISSTTPIYPYESEIQEIENLIKQGNIMPNLNNYEEVLLKGDKETLIDSNNTLNNLIINKSNGIDININNNQIEVSANTNSTKKESLEFVRRYNYYNNEPTYFISNDYQDCLIPGKLDYKYSTYNFNIETGTITINQEYFNLKTKKWEYPEGLVVELYNQDTYELLDSKTTDSFGSVSFKNLNKGNYVYTLERKKGYKQIEDGIITVDKNNYNIVKNFSLTQEKLDLEINVFREDFYIKDKEIKYEYKEVEDSTVGLYDEDDNLIKTYQTTSGNIKDTIETYFGSYYIKQLTTTTGYEVDENKYNFIYEEDDRYLAINIFNKLKKGKLIINKVDEETNNPLENVSFSILNENKEIVFSSNTNSLGIIELTLPYGTYYIKEDKTLSNYILNDELKEIKIDKEEINITVTNKKIIIENKEEESDEKMKEEILIPDITNYQEEVSVDRTLSNNYNYMYIISSIIALLIVLCKRHLLSYL